MVKATNMDTTMICQFTHLPLVPHICISELGIISSGNRLSPVQHQAIT